MEESENNVVFYKLLFGDELYHIDENKTYSDIDMLQNHNVSESEAAYHNDQSHFEGITSKTLIMFNYPESSDMPPGDKVLLGQVLKAVGLSFETVSRLNVVRLPQNTSWDNIAAQSGADYVIAFGVSKKYMPIGIDEGQIYNIDHKRVLYAATLTELIENNLRKKMLWQGLKEIYGI